MTSSKSSKDPGEPFFKRDDDVTKIPEFLQELDYWFRLEEIEDDSKKIDELMRRARDSISIIWGENLLDENPGLKRLTYDEVRQSFMEAHGVFLSNWQLWRNFRSLKQEGTIADYIKAFTKQVRLFPLDRPVADHVLLDHFVDGLTHSLYLDVIKQNPQTWKEAQRCAATIMNSRRGVVDDEASELSKKIKETSSGQRYDKRKPKKITKPAKCRTSNNRDYFNYKRVCHNCNKLGQFSKACPDKKELDSRVSFIRSEESNPFSAQRRKEKHRLKVAPKFGERKDMDLKVNQNNHLWAAIDTGSSTAFKHVDVVKKLKLNTHSVPLFRFKEAISPHVVKTNSDTTLTITHKKKTFKINWFGNDLSAMENVTGSMEHEIDLTPGSPLPRIQRSEPPHLK